MCVCLCAWRLFFCSCVLPPCAFHASMIPSHSYRTEDGIMLQSKQTNNAHRTNKPRRGERCATQHNTQMHTPTLLLNTECELASIEQANGNTTTSSSSRPQHTTHSHTATKEGTNTPIVPSFLSCLFVCCCVEAPSAAPQPERAATKQ